MIHEDIYILGTTLPGAYGNQGQQMVNGDYDSFDDRFRKVWKLLSTNIVTSK